VELSVSYRKHLHWVIVSYIEHVFRELVAEWLEWQSPAMVERELLVEPVKGLVAAVVGPRRAGKTYLLYQTAVKIGRAKAIYYKFQRREAGRPFAAPLRRLHKGAGGGRQSTGLVVRRGVEHTPLGVGQDSSRRRYAVVVTGFSSRLTLREVPTELRGRYLLHVPPKTRHDAFK
jgi:predicted AAA+ superfamily ATPase